MVTVLRRSLTVAALGMLVGFGGLSGLGVTTPDAPLDPLVALDPGEARLMAEHQCSATGFGDGMVPSQAILRQEDGTTELVSFDRGWASFTGDAPGTLVAVCLGAR
ncbi:hypothetical protein KUV85_11735 [Nocardioides panacisoli]|uniref:hypothetical protein n=1 Tax=Nocardioides panacisoli TaxID=627624 RepID=UPI001C62739F|nr:hypothetical protein [Nocardioides panacisoli]QYJ03004.1 hypothetical protein KUV85_11735 [Nocardioides panacisoli]